MNKEIIIGMPVKGSIIPLIEVDDYLFNKKIMGEGAAIKPEDDFLYSPVDGEVVLVYDFKHAIGIKTIEGLQVLIHVGIDTVKLEGKGFASYVKVGDNIKRGEKLLFFDRGYIDKKASTIIPIVITNPELAANIDVNFKAEEVGEPFIRVNLK